MIDYHDHQRATRSGERRTSLVLITGKGLGHHGIMTNAQSASLQYRGTSAFNSFVSNQTAMMTDVSHACKLSLLWLSSPRPHGTVLLAHQTSVEIYLGARN